MASQISKIGKIKTEEGVEGGMSRRPDSFGRMRGGLFFGIHLMFCVGYSIVFNS